MEAEAKVSPAATESPVDDDELEFEEDDWEDEEEPSLRSCPECGWVHPGPPPPIPACDLTGIPLQEASEHERLQALSVLFTELAAYKRSRLEHRIELVVCFVLSFGLSLPLAVAGGGLLLKDPAIWSVLASGVLAATITIVVYRYDYRSFSTNLRYASIRSSALGVLQYLSVRDRDLACRAIDAARQRGEVPSTQAW